MSLSSPGRGLPMADLNITPMVDVMLVLLIIFMVTAPLMQQGVPVELPTAQAQPLAMEDNRLVLALTQQRRIFLGTEEILYPQLRDKLTGNLKMRHDKQIFLHADRRLPYGFVVDVMAVLKEAGVENLGMVTDPSAPKVSP